MFSRKVVCFVTGSSRGLGESIATNLAGKFPEGSVIVLLARSEPDLEAVKNRLLAKSPHVTAIARTFDQSKQDASYFQAVFTETFKTLGVKAADFQQAIFVHNAGSIQPVKCIRNLPAPPELIHYQNTNFTGVIALTTEFLKFFPASSEFSRVVINISSLAAIQPFKSWAMYTSVKAARDMFFKVLAAEEERICVLSYAPGPLATDMSEVLRTDSEDEDVRKWATSAKEEKKLLTCDESTARLIAILEKNQFESGAHVDFYDDI
ncbi:hypothetical protein ACOMHN_006690 [Nucella lapillus]